MKLHYKMKFYAHSNGHLVKRIMMNHMYKLLFSYMEFNLHLPTNGCSVVMKTRPSQSHQFATKIELVLFCSRCHCLFIYVLCTHVSSSGLVPKYYTFIRISYQYQNVSCWWILKISYFFSRSTLANSMCMLAHKI